MMPSHHLWRQLSRKIIGVLGLWLLAAQLLAAPVVSVSDNFPYQPAGEFFEYLEDPSNVLMLQDILKPVNQKRFIATNYPFLQLGFNNSSWWLRLTLYNPDATPKELVLSFTEPGLSLIQLYAPYHDEVTAQLLYQQRNAGIATDHIQADIPAPGYWFRLKLAPEQTNVFYLRIKSDLGVTSPVHLGSERDSMQRLVQDNFWFGLGLGFLIIIVLYLLLIQYKNYRHRTILHLALYLFSMVLYLLTARGIIGQQVLAIPHAQTFMGILSLLVGQVSLILFAGSYLKPGMPESFERLSKIVAITLLIILVSCSVLPIRIAALLTYSLAILVSIAILTVAVIASSRGYRPAYYLLAGRTGILIGAVISSLAGLGFFIVHINALWTVLISTVLEAILLAIGLSERLSLAQEKSLRQHESELVSSTESRARQDFLSHMSHELRTPMSGIMGMAELLLDTPLTPNQKEYATTIQISGNALLSTLNDILDHARMEDGKFTINEEPFDLAELLNDTLTPLQGVADSKHTELIVSVSPTLPNKVLGDPTRLRQIIGNLLRNAIKYTQNGEIELSLKPGKLGLHVEVRDTGIGIPPEQITQIFQPYQLASNNIRPQTGTGIGLSICKELVEMMGGEIGVESKLKEGSRFWFDLPLKTQADAQSPAQDDNHRLRGLRLLVVDDNPTVTRVIQEQTSNWGMKVSRANNGSEALALARNAANLNEPYDVILLDDNMPRLTGFQVATHIKNDPLIHNNVIVLLLSNAHIDENDARLQGTGVRKVLTKPVTERLLYAAITEEVDHQLQHKPAPLPLTSGTFPRLHVLVAEDNHLSQKVIRNMLEKLNAKVTVVANGREVVEEISRGDYDMILMDCDMPFMDGYAAAQAIREWERLTGQASTPILALTAHILEEHQEKSKNAGMNEHLSKPIELADLQEALLRWAPTHL